MCAFVEEVQVDIAQCGQEPVGIVPLPARAVCKVETQTVAERQLRPREERRKETAFSQRFERDGLSTGQNTLSRRGVRVESADHHPLLPAFATSVRPQDAVGIVVVARQQPFVLITVNGEQRTVHLAPSLSRLTTHLGSALSVSVAQEDQRLRHKLHTLSPQRPASTSCGVNKIGPVARDL